MTTRFNTASIRSALRATAEMILETKTLPIKASDAFKTVEALQTVARLATPHDLDLLALLFEFGVKKVEVQ